MPIPYGIIYLCVCVRERKRSYIYDFKDMAVVLGPRRRFISFVTTLSCIFRFPVLCFIGEFCVCKQTPLCLSYVISHGCLLRLVAIERNAFLLYFAPLKILFPNIEKF